MVISVTPMVCITLAFWLGRIGLIASGGCCASASGAAQMTANRIAKVKREGRFREIIVALLVVEFGALCIAPRLISKGSGALCNKNLQLFTNPAGSARLAPRPLVAGSAGALARRSVRSTLKGLAVLDSVRETEFALRAQCGRGRPRSQQQRTGASGHVPAVLLTCFDREWQTILARRQRAGCEFRESTRRAVGLVEVDDHSARGVGRIDVQVSPGRIGLFAAGVVGEDHEQLWLALFSDRIQPVALAINFKRDGARRLFSALHAEDVHDWHLLRRIVRFEARVDAPLQICRIGFNAGEVRAGGIVFVFDANPELVAALNDLQTQRTETQHGRFVFGVRFKFEGSDWFVGSSDIRVCRGFEFYDAVLENEDTGKAADLFFWQDDFVCRIAAEFVLAFLQPEQSNQREISAITLQLCEPRDPILLDLLRVSRRIKFPSGRCTRSRQQGGD